MPGVLTVVERKRGHAFLFYAVGLCSSAAFCRVVSETFGYNQTVVLLLKVGDSEVHGAGQAHPFFLTSDIEKMTGTAARQQFFVCLSHGRV